MTRQEAMEWLKFMWEQEHAKGDLSSISRNKEIALQMAIDAMKQPEMPSDRWVSTKNGLPSCNRVYLIALKTPEGPPQVMEAYLDYGGTWWRGNVSLISEYVTHWMPLPEPPKEDDDHD